MTDPADVGRTAPRRAIRRPSAPRGTPGPADDAPPALVLAPWLLYLYPLIGALASRSEFPTVLGRYSTAFFAYNLWSLALAVALPLLWRRRAHLALLAALLALALTTLALPTNTEIMHLPWIGACLPAIRLLCGVAIVLTAFGARRRVVARGAGAWIGVGMLWIAVSLVDFVLLGVLALAPEQRRADRGLRESYALETIDEHDIVLVGDSFVWGQGVTLEQRMGNRLEWRLHEAGLPGRVLSLGQLGFGLGQYLQTLRDLPADRRAARVLIAFYMNDMPPPETLGGKLRNLTASLGRGFPTFRLVGDKAAKLLTPDVEAYHRFVVDSYRRDHPTFDSRWALLERQLGQIHEAARARSLATPVLVLLPLMVDFERYPLEEATAQLVTLARAQGFDVLDVLPLFRRRLVNGIEHRNAPDDNHFDALTHDLVAAALFERLTAEGTAER